jgi:hypothetical protein
MIFKKETAPWKSYLTLAIIFAIVVSFNFTKPFGFFRESNPALVAINASYWKDNPDIRKHNVPVSSFAFNKELPPATQFDNTITTFGYGWFAAPYYFLHFTNTPSGPIGLRIFSVLWLAFTVFTIYKLVSKLSSRLPNNKTVRFVTVGLYVLSPVVMWYQVNGYVHETAVLPFYYLSWYFFLRLLEEKKTSWLAFTAMCLFIGIQFDWLPFFQGFVMSAYLLFSRKEKLQKWMFLIPGPAILLGIGYIIYTYSSWASVTDYFHFMRWKFGTRTIGEEGPTYISFLPPNLNIIFFYVLSYGALLFWSIMGLIKRRSHPFIWLMIITAILHHIVFWGFSSEHDYAALKMAFPLAFFAATFINQMKKRTAMLSLAVILLFSIAQYFLLHNYSYRKGMYADDHFFYKAGIAIKAQAANAIVFLDTDNKYFPQVEFYAGRAYKMASSVEDAKQQLMKLNGSGTGVFIELKNGQIVQTTVTLNR